MKEQMDCCWFESFQHRDTRAASLLWADLLDSLMRSPTGKSFIKWTLYCNMWFLWLLGKLSPRFRPHTEFAACCLNISLGNVTLFPLLEVLKSGADGRPPKLQPSVSFTSSLYCNSLLFLLSKPFLLLNWTGVI